MMLKTVTTKKEISARIGIGVCDSIDVVVTGKAKHIPAHSGMETF